MKQTLSAANINGLTANNYGDSGIENYLLTRGLISTEDITRLHNYMRHSGKSLKEALVELLGFNHDEVQRLFYQYLDIPFVSLSEIEIDCKAAQTISEEVAYRYCLIPFRLQDQILEVAMADPMNRRALSDLHLYTGYEIKPYWSTEEEIKEAIRHCLTLELSIAHLAVRETDDLRPYRAYVLGADSGGEDAPAIRLVDSLLEQAITSGASDIHWEPLAQDFQVRTRIDGELQTIRRLPIETARSVCARLKVLARMDVAERRLPQDGSFTIEWGKRHIDLRVSSLPTVYGEKIVVRILDSFHSLRRLNELGMRPETEQAVRNLLQNPYGLILVAGPTGSGKTTTLYAMLREIATEQRNVVSIEDPVEYRLTGVNQVNVQPKIGLTFGRGLRAILRQDPDVIMIGEIRDQETAQIAVSAALTGHLVLSTVHTNTAAEAITRLLDIKIEPYLLASALIAVLSQRLVKKLCPHCRSNIEASPEAIEFFPSLSGRLVFSSSGCPNCRGGYKGRVGIYELLPYDEDIKRLILERRTGAEIEQVAVTKGMVPLIEDGLMKVIQGFTSIQEMIKVKVMKEIKET